MITVKHFKDWQSVTATPYEFKQALPHVHRLNRRAYTLGLMQPNYPVPTIYQCHCGYSLEAHKDRLVCENLGFLQY